MALTSNTKSSSSTKPTIEDNKGNILILGNSGVGKSTLINSILGTEDALTGIGIVGTTDKLTVYDSDDPKYDCEGLHLRLIDTPGFEPSIARKIKIISAVKKWSSDSAKENKNPKINEIWFCVDGTAAKLFSTTIKDLISAISLWKTVPIIVVITKSYGIPDRKKNIQMVQDAFSDQKALKKNLKAIIPIVASAYEINDSMYVAPDGIPELIEKAIEILPEGKRAATHDVNAYNLQRRRILSQTVVGTAVAGAVVVGFAPIPFADAALLGPIELTEVNAVATVYGIMKDDRSKRFIDSIIQVGTVSAAAKAAISALKAIPGINIAVGMLNAIIAGGIAAAIGEGSIYAFEQIYLGKKSIEDIDWVTKFMENSMTNGFIEKMTEIIKQAASGADKNKIAQMIASAFSKQ